MPLLCPTHPHLYINCVHCLVSEPKIKDLNIQKCVKTTTELPSVKTQGKKIRHNLFFNAVYILDIWDITRLHWTRYFIFNRMWLFKERKYIWRKYWYFESPKFSLTEQFICSTTLPVQSYFFLYKEQSTYLYLFSRKIISFVSIIGTFLI